MRYAVEKIKVQPYTSKVTVFAALRDAATGMGLLGWRVEGEHNLYFSTPLGRKAKVTDSSYDREQGELTIYFSQLTFERTRRKFCRLAKQNVMTNQNVLHGEF